MNAFLRKLRHGSNLTAEDEAVLVGLARPARSVGRGDIVPEGATPRGIVLILEGWACRYKQLENGKRQTTAVYLPGDVCEPFGTLPPLMDHTLAALTPAVVAYLPLQALRAAAQASPRIERALWWDLLLLDGVAREHIVSLGRRTATERLGHFFCEMHVRSEMAGIADRTSYVLPLTQAELADLFGLSAVHVNRSLQELRRSGCLSFVGRNVTVHDVQALRELSMFDPSYLRLDGADWS